MQAGSRRTRAAPVVIRRGHAAVVSDDDLLDERETEARALRLGGEERPEERGATSSGTPGPLSLTLSFRTPCAAIGLALRSRSAARPAPIAGFERVAAEIASACRSRTSSPSTRPNVAADIDVTAAGAGLRPDFFGDALDEDRPCRRGASASSVGLANDRKLVTICPSDSVSSRIA